ncbi:hypothetical protein PBY51_018447 [Eleginops maclovinus]|uniref:PH domain-containing protein n=1 Tax=Eleginops maclovinus TaxID=56733 RepID=A0AAN8AXF3_ELEMC|nr:hypothetical protein PBY51_018447 [Eleginops maclovinus]
MKKNGSGKRGLQDSALLPPPEKLGWIRRFCGRGIFREIWKNRFVVLRADQLFICEKEVKELGRADEVLDLSDYERCEEIRKNKSRSKKNHSKFRVQRCSSPGNTVPNLVFLAVSPEEKESWIQVLNASITRAKNRILDEVTVEDNQLSHLTRDRVKIPQTRRLPTRGHLLAVASSSDGALTLDLIQEEDPTVVIPLDCPLRSRTDGALCARAAEASGKSQSLPQEVQTPLAGNNNRCTSMDQILTSSEPQRTAAPQEPPVARLQELIAQKLQDTERLLTEVRGGTEEATDAKRLLQEAAAVWSQAREVLQEVKELQDLYRQLDPPSL